MSRYIIHKDGVYNIYSTIADSPIYVGGLTLEQVKEFTEREEGACGLMALPKRIAWAHDTGCSSPDADLTLEELVSDNRAGIDGRYMPFDEFVARYLTVKVEEGGVEEGGVNGVEGEDPGYIVYKRILAAMKSNSVLTSRNVYLGHLEVAELLSWKGVNEVGGYVNLDDDNDGFGRLKVAGCLVFEVDADRHLEVI